MFSSGSRPADSIVPHSPLRVLRAAVTLSLLLVIAGCSEVRFTQLPAGSVRDCDSRAVGRWLSADEPDNDSALVVSEDCERVEVVERKSDGSIDRDVLDVSWIRTQGRRVAAVASDKPDESGQWHLVRYRIRGDRLDIFYPDIEGLAARVDAGTIAGEVISRDSDGDAQEVLVTADRRKLARLIGRGELFRKKPEGRFVRAMDEAEPED